MKKNPLHFVLFCCLFAFTIQAQETEFSLYQLLNSDQNAASVIAENTTINNLESLNTEHLDYSPTPYKNGIVFTSTRKQHKQWWKNLFKKQFSFLFYAVQKDDGTFQAARPLKGELNGQYNEGAATFSADGKMMVFTRNSSEKNSNGYYDLQLFTAEYDHGQWINVQELPFNSEQYTNAHPSLSADGKQLYFASNRPGGLGGMDIYMAEWINNNWSQPVNLGEQINSDQHELFPTIGTDGQLYFSSNQKPSNGQLDIFVAQKQKGNQWSDKHNLGAPFNSPMDDFGWMLNKDGRSGFFTSNRDQGHGEDDIYSWNIGDLSHLNNQHLLSQIKVIDAKSKASLDETVVTLVELEVTISTDVNREEPLFIAHQIDEDVLNLIGNEIAPIQRPDGENWYALQPDKHYLVIAEKNNYAPIQQLVSYDQLVNQYAIALQSLELKTTDDIVQTEEAILPPHPSLDDPSNPLVAATAIIKKADKPLPGPVAPIVNLEEESTKRETAEATPINDLKKRVLRDNTIIQLNNIYFGFNEFKINALSEDSLDELARLLEANPTMEIRILSHTDARGKASYNQKLSQRRADAVLQYLVDKGIETKRLSAIGLGEEQLLNQCDHHKICTDEEHEQNRRTEFQIVKR